MATLDLGTLGFEISVDTGNFDQELAGVKSRVEAVDKQLNKAGKTTIKPNVDTKGVDKLNAALGDVGKNADKLSGRKVTPQADTRKVQELKAGLDEAGRAAKTVELSPGFTPSLSNAAQKARELAGSFGGLGGGAGALGKVTGAVKGLVPALSAASAGTAVFTKGWGRLTAIEGAEATLKGLGNSAQDVSEIMDSALTSVKGTSVGMGEAASTAATAVAAGVQPGKELTQVLTTMADTAAISGSSMQEVGLIFNSVLSRGKLQGDDMMQLMSRGIPVLQIVADQLGITAQEASEMATEGQISFEIFEEAMRNRVGGAAQEAGSTVKGSLANVGAAVGRLGATVEGPLFTLLPAGLSAVTAGIDAIGAVASPVFGTVDAGLTKMVDAWGGLPTPIKTVTISIGAARVALALLNTEMGKKATTQLMAGLTTARAGMATFRANVAATTAQLKAANPGMTTFGAGLRAVGTNAAVATGGLSLLRGAASGLMALLGGPMGIAMMAVGAGIGVLISQFQKHKQAAEESKQATKEWADALNESQGRIDENIQRQALATVQAEELGDAFKLTGRSASEMARAITDDAAYDAYIQSLDQQIEKLGHVAEADRRANSEAFQHKQALEAQKESAERLRGEFTDGAEQARENAREQQKLADETAAAADAAGEARPRWEELDGVFAGVGEEAKTVDDVIKQLAQRLDGLSDDPAVRLQAYTDEMHAAMNELSKTITAELPELNMDTGVWDQGTEATIKANSYMREFSQTLNETAAAQYELNIEQGKSHVEAAQAARDATRGFADQLREQLEATGMSKAEVDKLVETYASVPDEVFTQLETAGLENADELAKSVKFNLAKLNDDATVLEVDASAISMSEEEAEKLGFKMDKLDDGRTIQLRAESESAKAALSEVEQRKDVLNLGVDFEVRAKTEQAAAALDQLEGVKAYFGTNPAELGVVADTEQARAELDRMKVDYTAMGGQLFIQDNTDEVQGNLAEVGAKVESMPGGWITIDTDADHAQEALEQLGVQTVELPDGELLVTSNAEDVQAEMQRIAEWTEAFGSEEQVLDFLADTTEFDMSAQEVADRINELDRSGATPVTGMDIQEYLDRDGDVRQGLLELSAERGIPLADLNPAEFNTGRDNVNRDLDSLNSRKAVAKIGADDSEARGVVSNLLTWIGNQLSRPFRARVSASSGHADGGLVGFAGGGVSYGSPGSGYVLPESGPGTETTDGILGVGRGGDPTAWLDRGEFVVNRGSTRKFEPALWQINSGNAVGAIEALQATLPGYVDGGIVSADELLAFADGENVNGDQAPGSLEGYPYTWGGGLTANWGDCSGAMSGLAAFSVGMDIQGRKFATGNEGAVLASMGAEAGLGSGPRIAFGWFNGGPWGGHTAGTIYDEDGTATNVEMGGGRGNGQIGGAAAGAGDPSFTDHAWLPLAEGGRDDDYDDDYGSDFDEFDPDYTSTSGVHGTVGGKKRSIDWGTASHLASDVEERRHRRKQLARYNAGVYDQGGVLGPDGIAVNMSGKPEKVLDPQLSESVDKLAGVAPKLVKVSEGRLVVEPKLTAAMNDLSGWAQRVVQTGGNRAQMYELGWERVQMSRDMHAQGNMDDVDRWAAQMNQHAGQALMGAAAMGASDWLDLGQEVGLEFLGGFTGVADSYDEVQDSFVAQVDAVDALAEAQQNYAEAQEELNEAMGEGVELSDGMKRKLEDAEENVEKARKDVATADSDKSKAKATEKLAKAEEKLSRVREDADKEMEKNGEANTERVEAAREAVKEAATGVDTASAVVKAAAAATGQAEIAMAVEVFKVAKDITKKIIELVQRIRDEHARAWTGSVESIASALGSVRDLSLATAKQRNLVAELQAKVVEAQIAVRDATWKVRVAQDAVQTAQLQGILKVKTAQEALQEEEDRLAGKRRYNFIGLDVEYDRTVSSMKANTDSLVGGISDGIGRIGQDAQDVSESTSAELRAVDALTTENLLARMKGEEDLTGVTSEQIADRLGQLNDLTDEEKQRVKSVFDGKFADYDREHATLEEQREWTDAYYAMQKAGLGDLMEQSAQESAERLANLAEVHAAEAEKNTLMYQAQLDQLDAAHALADASMEAVHAAEDAHIAQLKLNKLNVQTMGIGAEDSVVLAQIADIMAENAQADADMKKHGFGRGWDWDNDGMVLGVFQNEDSQKYQAAQRTKAANEELLAELSQRLSGDVTLELTAEDRKAFRLAGQLRANGETERAEAVIRGTSLGRAKTAQLVNEVDDQIAEIEADRREARRRREESLRKAQQFHERQPLARDVYYSQAEESAWRYEADAFRSDDAGVRDANRALADNSRSIVAGRDPFADLIDESMARLLSVQRNVLMAEGQRTVRERSQQERRAGIGGLFPQLSALTRRMPGNSVVKVLMPDGQAFTTEQVEGTLRAVNDRVDGVEIEVSKIRKQTSPLGGRKVQLARAGIRR